MTDYKSVFFEPWVGPEYDQVGLWGRKVLIVGESHYNHWSEKAVKDQPPPPIVRYELGRSMTVECVQEIVDGARGAYYWNRVRNRIGGEEYENQVSAAFWNKVAFYNLVQSPVEGGPGDRPTLEQWHAVHEPLREVLEVVRPERVVFTGWTLWGHVPPRDGKHADLEVGAHKIPVEFFDTSSGARVYVTATAHPRTQYFVRLLTPLLQDFIRRDWEGG